MNNLKNQGLALIEVLITILVVAIGMLAYAALQVKTVNVTQESYFRSQAISVIEEATSKMRANSEFIAGDANNVYVSDNASGSFDEWCNFAPPAARPTLTCTGNCADDALATYNKESSCIKLLIQELRKRVWELHASIIMAVMVITVVMVLGIRCTWLGLRLLELM